ncbi:MAG: SLC13 family permease [Methanomicrobiales archaeon]|nr:SLC13 family permease [Methanomicrobiales archaeon]
MNRIAGLLSGILLFVLVLLIPLAPDAISTPARITLAVTSLMVVWWVTETIPIYVTALIPLILFPIFGVLSPEEAARSYADNTVFLFMGGFFIAVTMERWNLHRRIALNIIRRAGAVPGRVVLSFMLATAFLSMWISNTASAMMMVPIALSVIRTLNSEEGQVGKERYGDFSRSLLIGVAYAATIGGMATIIGTPPNGILIAQLKRLFPLAPGIDFFSFMLFALPYSLLFLLLSWVWITKVSFRHMPERIAGTDTTIVRELERLGHMQRGEVLTLAVFLLTAIAWIFRSEKDLGFIVISGLNTYLPGIQDSTIAIFGALLLFTLPVNLKKVEFVLDWETAKGIPWGILILFGGGICLSEAFLKSGLASSIADRLTALQALPLFLIVIVMALGISFLNEFVSNTAIASIMIPLMAFAAVSISINPLLLMIVATFASSLGFMLPVGTPPNAIVYGTGFVSTRDMLRAGLALNITGSLLLALFMFTVVPLVTGLESGVPLWARLGG